MASINTTHVQKIDEISKSVKVLEELFFGTKAFLGQLTNKVIWSPIIIIIYWFMLRYIRAVLKQSFRVDHTNVTFENFKDLRFYYDMAIKVINIERLLKEEIEGSDRKIPWYIWPITYELKKIVSFLKQYKKTIDPVLAEFDTPKFKGNYFKRVSEKELWENRCKDYEYLI